jgi:hypothetical protein
MPEGGPPRGVASRRRYERIPLTRCSVEVFRYIFFGMKEKAMAGKAVGVDLSEVGIGLALPERVTEGEKLRLVARVEIFADTIEGEGTVVWCAPNALANGLWKCGLEWTSLVPGHFAKIQQMRKAMRSKEFQQKLQTNNRMKKEDRGDDSGLEVVPPRER